MSTDKARLTKGRIEALATTVDSDIVRVGLNLTRENTQREALIAIVAACARNVGRMGALIIEGDGKPSDVLHGIIEHNVQAGYREVSSGEDADYLPDPGSAVQSHLGRSQATRKARSVNSWSGFAQQQGEGEG